MARPEGFWLDPAKAIRPQPRTDPQQDHDAGDAKMLRNRLSEYTRGERHDEGHDGRLNRDLHYRNRAHQTERRTGARSVQFR